MSDLRKKTPSQIGNMIFRIGLTDLGEFIQSELQELEFMRKEVATLSAKVRLLEQQLPEEATEKVQQTVQELWLKQNGHGGSRRAPAISDG